MACFVRCIAAYMKTKYYLCTNKHKHKKVKDLTPLIQSHFLNGIPPKELTDSVSVQRRLADLFSLFEMYHENPCMDVTKALKFKFHHTPREIVEDLVYFEMMRSSFSRMTRQKAQDLVNWSAEKVMRDAAAVNDRKGMLDAAKVLVKANQLDKPAPDSDDAKNMRQLDIVFTPYVEVIDPDRKTIEDKKLLKIMKQYDAHIDTQEEKIEEKLQEIEKS